MATPKKSGKNAASPKKNKDGKELKKRAPHPSGLTFPVGRVRIMLKRGGYFRRVSSGGGIFLTAVLEYLCAETLELAGKAVKDMKRVTPRNLCLAIRHDADLGSLLSDVTISRGGVAASGVAKGLEKKKKGGKKGGKKAKKEGGEKKKKSGGKKAKKASKKAKKASPKK